MKDPFEAIRTVGRAHESSLFQRCAVLYRSKVSCNPRCRGFRHMFLQTTLLRVGALFLVFENVLCGV